MQIKASYSHLNGEEYLIVHRKPLLEEVRAVIEQVDAYACRTKVSKERTMRDKLLFSPTDMSRAFKEGLVRLGWSERRSTSWVTDDEKILRRAYPLPEEEQKEVIEAAGLTPIMSYNQTDFVKERIAVEVQFANMLSSPTTYS